MLMHEHACAAVQLPLWSATFSVVFFKLEKPSAQLLSLGYSRVTTEPISQTAAHHRHPVSCAHHQNKLRSHIALAI